MQNPLIQIRDELLNISKADMSVAERRIVKILIGEGLGIWKEKNGDFTFVEKLVEPQDDQQVS